MILLFSLLTFLSLPSIYYFLSYTDDSSGGFFRRLEMGNMGFAQALCRDVPLGVGIMHLTCSTGFIQEIVSFGIIPHNANIMDACTQNVETDTCEGMFHRDQIEIEIVERCFQKQTCHFDVNDFLDLNPENNENCRNEFTRFFI